MGQVSGKLNLRAGDAKKTEPVTAIAVTDTTETASKLVNGEANAVSSVPPIDEEIEPKTDQSATETQPTDAVAQGDESTNGPVDSETTDSQAPEKKKSKNPIGWIKRRFSKKSISSKTKGDKPEAEATGDKAEDDSAVPATPVAETDSKLETTETASSLVQEVLTSAVALEEVKKDQDEPVQTTEIIEPAVAHDVAETPVVESIDVEITQPSSLPCEPEIHDQEPVPEVVTPQVNGHHENGVAEEVGEMNGHAVVDENNTNVYKDIPEKNHENGSHIADEVQHFDHPEQHDHDAVAAKLAALDLTNGNSDHVNMNGNGDYCPTAEAVNVD